MASATAILIVSMFVYDTMESLIDVTYFMADRQDATVSFNRREAPATLSCRWRGFLVFLRPSPIVKCLSAYGAATSNARHYQRQAPRCRPQPHYRY
jgi:hypothetical protein